MIVIKKVFQWPLKKAKEAENKNDQKGPILNLIMNIMCEEDKKTKFVKKFILKEAVKTSKIQHLYYGGLIVFLTDFG